MKGNTITWIVVGCAIFIALLWLLFTFLTPHGYDWRESYYVNDEEPFCTSVLADITETYFPNTEFEIIKNNIRISLDTSITKNKNYFFAGKSFHMNDSTIRAFLDFIDRGNDAFIAAKYFSDEFAQELFYTYEYEIPEDTLIEEEVYIEIPEDEENDIDSIFNFHEDFFQDDSYTTDNNIITTLSSQNININFVDPE
ncbi:MAG: hypothetical protein H7Y00_12225, partial [Fimbriimonadaceae bacterium]|nr:hypothetical protein [Chitinophagales bacterium]